MTMLSGKELAEYLDRGADLFKSTSFEIINEKFRGLDYDELLIEIFEKAKSTGDIEIEYICRRSGIAVTRLKELQDRVINFLENDKEWQIKLKEAVFTRKEEHHPLCSHTTDHTFCDCGILGALGIGD